MARLVTEPGHHMQLLPCPPKVAAPGTRASVFQPASVLAATLQSLAGRVPGWGCCWSRWPRHRAVAATLISWIPSGLIATTAARVEVLWPTNFATEDGGIRKGKGWGCKCRKAPKWDAGESERDEPTAAAGGWCHLVQTRPCGAEKRIVLVQRGARVETKDSGIELLLQLGRVTGVLSFVTLSL